jgi:tetratricopeptide (TPR) repeat protein
MKKANYLILSLILLFSVVANGAAKPAESSPIPQGRNTIYGAVYGDSRFPLRDIYVELQDDVSGTIGQVKTDQSGRFRFSGLVDGRYILRVRPYGTDYLETTREVILTNISMRGGSVTENVDIVLNRNERANTGPFEVAPEGIFAQEVPPAAKKSYEQGIGLLRDKKETEAFNSLKAALEIFPNYYLALNRLGSEYATRGLNNRAYLQAGYSLLSKAVEINPNGFSAVYGLGWTQYQLGLNEEAIASLKRATSLYPKGADAFLLLGKALKRASTFDQAEAALKRANELNSGKSSEPHWQLAALYNDTKRYKEAADELELFLKYEPKAENAEKIRGMIKSLRAKTDGQ